MLVDTVNAYKLYPAEAAIAAPRPFAIFVVVVSEGWTVYVAVTGPGSTTLYTSPVSTVPPIVTFIFSATGMTPVTGVPEVTAPPVPSVKLRFVALVSVPAVVNIAVDPEPVMARAP